MMNPLAPGQVLLHEDCWRSGKKCEAIQVFGAEELYIYM